MKQILAQRRRQRRLVLSIAALLAGLSGDIHAFAGEPASLTAPGGVESQSPAQAKTHLLTREEMLNGMIEAEKKRAIAMRPDPAIDNKAMMEQWGVQVISVSYAADGFWLNFRFRVVDVDKSKILFDSKIKPYLESDATGIKLGVPDAAKIGALRTTNRGKNIQPNKIYNIMFSNPGFHVGLGQKVSVVIGDFKAEHMTVKGIRENLRVKKIDRDPVPIVKIEQ